MECVELDQGLLARLVTVNYQARDVHLGGVNLQPDVIDVLQEGPNQVSLVVFRVQHSDQLADPNDLFLRQRGVSYEFLHVTRLDELYYHFVGTFQEAVWPYRQVVRDKLNRGAFVYRLSVQFHLLVR